MISNELRLSIKRLASYKVKNKEISEITGVSVRTISRIKKEEVDYIVDEEVCKNKNLGRPSQVAKYEKYILQWIKYSQQVEGRYLKGKEILEKLRLKGYLGGKTAAYDLIKKVRLLIPPSSVKEEERNEEEWMHMLIQGKIENLEIKKNLLDVFNSKEIELLIDNLLNRPLRHRNRAVTIIAFMSDINRKVISEYLFLGLDTINKYIKIYKTDGIEKLFDFSYSNIKKSDNKKYIDKVFEIIHSPPAIHGINRTSWRQSDVYQIMKKKGFKVSKDNIRKIIKNAGYSYRNAKKVLTSSDPAYKEKLKAIQDILSNLRSNEKFFSIDEFGPFSVKIYGGKVLTPPGQLRTVPQWQKSKGSLIATAALELSTNQVSHFYSEKKNTKEMIRLIGLLLEEYKNENCIYISWDAASWHASQELYKYVEEVNKKDYRNTNKTPIVKLAPLPSGAQFLNVIESVFSGMSKAILHNSNYESIEHCKKAIDRYFDERNQHFKENPKRAGKKIWGNEIVKPVFSESNNCKDPRWR